jgi:lipopolysaccharide export system permease protein
MKTLDRYIGRVVLVHSGVVLMVLLAIYVFMSFMNEMDNLGRGSYTFVNALAYVAMLIPRQAYELFPMVALLGTMLGLGSLASTSELTVIRAAGVSVRRITLSVFKIGLVMVLVAVVMGEVIAPPLEKQARVQRATLLAKNISIGADDGVWVREDRSYINIRRLLPEGVASGVRIYRFDDHHRLVEAVAARRAVYAEGAWRLYNVRSSIIGDDAVQVTSTKQQRWEAGLTPDVFRVAAVPPENLSAVDLYQYVVYLRSNNLDSRKYELAFWIRVVTPFATAGMVLMALPFILGSLRSVSVGQRILVGALIGIVFYLFNATFSRFGVVYELSPFLSAVLPTVMVFGLWWFLMRRVV